jgi:arylsulfatase A-like enzyme
MGREQEQQAHEHLYWEFGETDQIAVRQGDWKLIVKHGRSELYDLSSDVHEDHDVAAENPDKVRELIGIVYQEHEDNPNFRVTLP